MLSVSIIINHPSLFLVIYDKYHAYEENSATYCFPYGKRVSLFCCKQPERTFLQTRTFWQKILRILLDRTLRISKRLSKLPHRNVVYKIIGIQKTVFFTFFSSGHIAILTAVFIKPVFAKCKQRPVKCVGFECSRSCSNISLTFYFSENSNLFQCSKKSAMKVLISFLIYLIASTVNLNAKAQQQIRVDLTDIGLLLPTTADLISGDREFGRGPFVTCRVTLQANGNQILGWVYLKMAETEPDYTTIQKTWGPFVVYTAPSNIVSIDYPTVSETNYRAVDGGWQIFGSSSSVSQVLFQFSNGAQIAGQFAPPPLNVILDAAGQVSAFGAGILKMSGRGDNYVNITRPDNNQGPVYQFFIVADTGGDDISDDDNPDDDARIEAIQFKKQIPITIQ